MFTADYDSPVGKLLLASDGTHLTGLWLEGQQYYAAGLNPNAAKEQLAVFDRVKIWLDAYFAGQNPDPTILPMRPEGTLFRLRIWQLLQDIPYGSVITYGELAEVYEKRFGKRTSPRAVGGAVGHNPISIIVPCHRVVGGNGTLTGYAGGVERKKYLLDLEQKNCRG
jgi:methylated-DNA-[protein]-cysteine S-methyltransferase